MVKTKYQYNPETVSYEKIELSLKKRIFNFFKYIISSSILAVAIVLMLFFVFETPKEKNLIRENKKLLSQYNKMNKQLDDISIVLSDIEKRDDNIYRVIFEADPISKNSRKSGFGGVNRYRKLENFKQPELIISTAKKLDKIKKSLYVQTTSFDDVEVMLKNKFKMLASIPAIMPIAIKDFRSISSGFGVRIHPIYKTRKFHDGMDFTGKIGTPIYSTGEGKIESAKSSRGYGKKIVINHGYGYKTIYAHLSRYNVKAGQKIKRGEIIGFLGNTGISTGPHLHYEVRKNNKKLNPINYYFNDISAKQYDKIVEIAQNTGQTMD